MTKPNNTRDPASYIWQIIVGITIATALILTVITVWLLDLPASSPPADTCASCEF